MVLTSRRRLLQMSFGAALATQLRNSIAASEGGRPVGIQLFTVREPLQKDIQGTLNQVSAIGFSEVETAGFAGLSAREFRAALDTAGLKCPSAHLTFDDAGNWGALFDDAHALGAQYVTSSLLRFGSGARPDPALDVDRISTQAGRLPPLAAMTLEDARRTAELANRIGEAAKRHGLSYAYHNHYLEFVPQDGGRIGYDVLLEHTDPRLVHFEIDCGWMIAAGGNPIGYFKKYPVRFPMIHAKDFLPLAPADPDAARKAFIRNGAELGHGFIDYKPIIAAGRAAGLQHVFAEQEGPFARMSQLQAATVAYRYLKSAGA